MSVGEWIRALIAIALLFAIAGLALVAHAMTDPPPRLTAAMCLLMSAFLLWLFWGPKRTAPDRYTIAWTVIAVVLALGGVDLLLNP